MAREEDTRRIYSIINQAGGPAGMLTLRARNMLVLPLTEVLDENNSQIDWSSVESSVKYIVNSLEPDEFMKGMFTARSVIRGFHKTFCGIPPFCGPVGK